MHQPVAGPASSFLARTAAAVLLLLLAAAAQSADHCVILQYHHFSDETPAITSVTPARFDEHLDYLKNNRFAVMPLGEVVAALAAGRALPDRCVSLTVDDAYISVYENAFPRLRKLGWPLTVFVNTEAIDNREAAYMTWDQMRELAARGVAFENHGHSHIHMIRRRENENAGAWRQRIIDDISTAQRRIRQELGIAPRLFAHPYGEYSPETLDIIRELGLTGFGQQSGPAWPGADFGALPRFPMAADYARMASFVTKVNSLPMPVVAVEPADPLVPLQQPRPRLKLTLAPGSYSKTAIQCFVAGSSNVDIRWPAGAADTLIVAPNFDLPAGRHRTNCTMPSTPQGRFHWYSHNWFVRKADGSWYPEY